MGLSNQVLANVSIFQTMSEPQRSQLLQAMSENRFEPDENILTTGTVERALCVVVEGEAAVILDVYGFENPLTEDGAAHIVDHTKVGKICAGSVFGEASFFHGGPHKATVRALTPMVVLKLSHAQYTDLLDRDDPLAHKIAHQCAVALAEKLQAADSLISELVLAQQDVVARSRWFTDHVEIYKSPTGA